jgi:hypothetical protein
MHEYGARLRALPGEPVEAVDQGGRAGAGTTATQDGFTLDMVAAAHVAVGLAGAAACVLAWWLIAGGRMGPALVLLPALGMALAGALGLLLGRIGGSLPALAGRGLLPVADLALAATILWLVNDRGLTTVLFVVPIAVAAALFSWRSAAAFAALALALFAATGALQMGTSRLEAWAPQTLALAAAAALTVVCLVAFTRPVTQALGSALEHLAGERARGAAQTADQRRFMENLGLIEETQLKLEQERAQVNAQIADLALAAQRLSEGDMSAPRFLTPGMYSPLDALAGALARLGQQMETTLAQRQQLAQRQRAAQALVNLASEQSRLLAAMEVSLRDISGRSQELVAEVQRIERGSGDLPGLDQHALFQVLRGLEQQSLANASNTSLLRTRLAQALARQAELEAQTRRVCEPTWASAAQSGVFAGSLPGAYSGVHPFTASGMFPAEAGPAASVAPFAPSRPPMARPSETP